LKKQIAVSDITAFEAEIADLFQQGKIKAPIHLRSGCEQNLIDIFKEIKSEDWVFN
jgi:pyruvate dehydrogenase E1 component alpha subunit